MYALASCNWPSEKLVYRPESNVSDDSFITACSSFRCPHFGCLIKPGNKALRKFIYISLKKIFNLYL